MEKQYYNHVDSYTKVITIMLLLYVIGNLLGDAIIQIIKTLQIAAASICANNISGHYAIDYLTLLLSNKWCTKI